MKARKENLAISTLTLAVQGALLVMFAMPMAARAQADDATALTQPTNFVEIGVENTSRDSAKFGEYNGLNKSGADLIGNFGLKGGDGYNGGTTRWQVNGNDLGTDSRELGAGVSNQGHWNLGINYDELRHNISDSYQTPLQGSMGGNSFNLPSSFGVINSSRGAAGTQALTATQLNSFHTQDVHSDRKNTGVTAGYDFDRQWAIKFDYNRLDQSGAKLMSPGTDAAVVGALSYGGEKTIMLMNPTNSTTDTYTVALNWTGDQAFASVGYFGSFYKDAYNSLTWPNPFASATGGTLASFPINTISTAPDNDFHQFNLSGGYSVSSATKLAGSYSYGRNTQNDSYPYAVMQAGGLPQSSLNALVVSTHGDLKLTNQTNRDLMLSAGLKYDEHDNRTASNTYNFLDLGAGAATSINAPLSYKKMQLELAGDYRIDPRNKLRLSYQYVDYKRWCNNDLANNAQSAAAPAGYYTNASCVQVPESKENTLAADYKLRASDAVSFNAGYSYAKRKADVNSSFYNPMQAISEGFENLGWLAWFQASRTEQLGKAGVTWQADDRLSVGLNGRYLDDQYDNQTLGVQKGHTWAMNLDTSYNYSEAGVVSAYLSLQKRQRDMSSGGARLPVTVSTNIWTNQLDDDESTVGLTAQHKGLMGGKLELSGDLSYSLGKTSYSTQVPYLATCSATTSLTCGSTPDIKYETTQLKLRGSYHVDKANKVIVGYTFQHLKSNDYYYNAYQTGYTSTGLLPTNEQAPNYSVNLVYAAYNHSFR